LTLDYTELRRRTTERDRSLREKVMSLEEALNSGALAFFGNPAHPVGETHGWPGLL